MGATEFYQGRDALIADYRHQGMKQSDIAKLLGCSLDVIKNTCRKLQITEEQTPMTVEEAAQKISEAGFDYISGFVNTHSKVVVACRECCTMFDVWYSSIRKSLNGVYSKIECPVCVERQKAQIERERQQQQEIRKQLLEQNKALKRSLKINQELLYLMTNRTCKNCGKDYCIQVTGYDSKLYCSDKCMKRYVNRTNRDKRYRTIRNRVHDNSITLEKVYNKDHGICYLCNGKCNWQDIEDHDGTLIAGNSYPSIDHVKPLNKGGTHTWDNVRLAHRQCNTIKRDN